MKRLALALLLTLTACDTPPHHPPMVMTVVPPRPKPQLSADDEGRYREIIAAYVQRTKGWQPDSYRVDYDGVEEGFVLFSVIYLPAQQAVGPNSVGGDGESFEAYINPETGQVEQALYFQ